MSIFHTLSERSSACCFSLSFSSLSSDSSLFSRISLMVRQAQVLSMLSVVHHKTLKYNNIFISLLPSVKKSPMSPPESIFKFCRILNSPGNYINLCNNRALHFAIVQGKTFTHGVNFCCLHNSFVMMKGYPRKSKIQNREQAYI